MNEEPSVELLIERTLMLRGFLAGLVEWRPFVSDSKSGELCFDGLCYVLKLDADGVPDLNDPTENHLDRFLKKALFDGTYKTDHSTVQVRERTPGAP